MPVRRCGPGTKREVQHGEEMAPCRRTRDGAKQPSRTATPPAGGSFCDRENPAKQKGPNAVPGLHSCWVGDAKMILAMARPWQENVRQLDLPGTFLKENVGMILNLQEVRATWG